MICSVCGEETSKSIKLFDKDICSLCMISIKEVPVNHILYDFYKDRIKSVIGDRLMSYNLFNDKA